MKSTFQSNTFASNTFSCSTWAGIGIVPPQPPAIPEYNCIILSGLKFLDSNADFSFRNSNVSLQFEDSKSMLKESC